MQKSELCFQSKKVKICSFFYHNNYYTCIYLKNYFEFVTNDFSIYWRTVALIMFCFILFLLLLIPVIMIKSDTFPLYLDVYLCKFNLLKQRHCQRFFVGYYKFL